MLQLFFFLKSFCVCVLVFDYTLWCFFLVLNNYMYLLLVVTFDNDISF